MVGVLCPYHVVPGCITRRVETSFLNANKEAAYTWGRFRALHSDLKSNDRDDAIESFAAREMSSVLIAPHAFSSDGAGNCQHS